MPYDLRIGRDVRIDHILQRIPCLRKGMPDDIGADAMIIIRIAARIIYALIARAAFHISAGSGHKVMIVIRPIAVFIAR